MAGDATRSQERELFDGERHLAKRARRLREVLSVVVAVVVIAVAVEVMPGVPQHLEVASAVVAAVLVIAAWRGAAVVGRDQRRVVAEAHHAIDEATVMFVALDRDSHIVLANPAACAGFARTEDQLIGRRIQDFFADASEATASLAAFAEIMSGRVTPEGYEVDRAVLRPGGQRCVCSWHFSVRRDSAGATVGVLCIGTDVTAERRRRAAETCEREDLEHLRRLARAVATQDDARQTVVSEACALASADFAVVLEPMHEIAGDWMHTAGTLPELTGVGVAADERSAALQAALAREPLFVPDAVSDPRVNTGLVKLTGVRALWFEPVLADGAVLAVLIVGWRHPVDQPDFRKSNLLGLCADELATAIKRVRTLRELQRAAMTDALTDVGNRRSFDDHLARAISRADRTHRPLTLVLLDLDAFKALNDREGHTAGDHVLRSCAQDWTGQLRNGDVLARLGGDEFAVILEDCTATDAEQLSVRLRASTPHAAGVSIGCATRSGHTSSQLYAAADRDLYRDKSARQPI